MEVSGHAPSVRDAAVFIDDAIAVVVDELSEFLFLENVDATIDDFESEGFGKSGSNLLNAHLGGGFVPVFDLVDTANGIPGANEHIVVGEESDAANSGGKIIGSGLGEIVGRVNAFKRASVAGAEVVDAHDAFFAGGRDANFSGGGHQSGGGNGGECVIAGFFPTEFKFGVAAVFKVLDSDRIFARVEFGLAGFE